MWRQPFCRSQLQARWMRQDHILLGLIGAPQSMSAIAPPNSAAPATCQQATSQACPDMNEAANQGGLGMTGARVLPSDAGPLCNTKN